MSNYNFDNTRKEIKHSSSFVFDNTREEKRKKPFIKSTGEKTAPIESLDVPKGKQENDTIRSKLNKSSNSKHSTNSSSASSSKQTTESKFSTESSSKINTTSPITISNKSNAVSMQKNTNKISKTTEPILKNILKIDQPKDLEDLDAKKMMYFIIAFIAVIIIISSLMSFNSPGKKIQRYLSNGEYSKAVSCYNDKASGHQNRESSIDPLFINCIDELSDMYYTDEINYDTVSKALDEFKNLSKKELSTYASNKLESINRDYSTPSIPEEADQGIQGNESNDNSNFEDLIVDPGTMYTVRFGGNIYSIMEENDAYIMYYTSPGETLEINERLEDYWYKVTFYLTGEGIAHQGYIKIQ